MQQKIENRITNKDFMPRILILNRDFALASEIIHDHKLSVLATVSEVLISAKYFLAFDASNCHS